MTKIKQHSWVSNASGISLFLPFPSCCSPQCTKKLLQSICLAFQSRHCKKDKGITRSVRSNTISWNYSMPLDAGQSADWDCVNSGSCGHSGRTVLHWKGGQRAFLFFKISSFWRAAWSKVVSKCPSLFWRLWTVRKWMWNSEDGHSYTEHLHRGHTGHLCSQWYAL